jgi:Family of unknown function (DUF6497)
MTRKSWAHCIAVSLTALGLTAGCQQDAADGEKVEVPSGRDLRLIDIITDAPGPQGATARFRFLAPGLSSDDLESSAIDMQAVCDSFAVGRIDGMVPAPRQIIISFSSAEVPFGDAAPDVVQFFESYRVENSLCIWEVY